MMRGLSGRALHLHRPEAEVWSEHIISLHGQANTYPGPGEVGISDDFRCLPLFENDEVLACLREQQWLGAACSCEVEHSRVRILRWERIHIVLRKSGQPFLWAGYLFGLLEDFESHWTCTICLRVGPAWFC